MIVVVNGSADAEGDRLSLGRCRASPRSRRACALRPPPRRRELR